MRRYSISLILFVLTGCASHKVAQVAPAPAAYLDRSAPSLVFDSPLVMNEPRLVLPREPREPAAFVGFEELTTTFFYVRNDDRQLSDGTHWLSRQAVTEKAGVSYR